MPRRPRPAVSPSPLGPFFQGHGHDHGTGNGNRKGAAGRGSARALQRCMAGLPCDAEEKRDHGDGHTPQELPTVSGPEEPPTSATDFDADALREKYRMERDKRIRSDGNAQYVEVAGQFADYLHDPYTEAVERPPLVDDVTVAVIGGGFAGLITGARLRQAGIDDFRIIEKGGDFGGTWYWNRYPGGTMRRRVLRVPPAPRGDLLRPEREVRPGPRDPRALPPHRPALRALRARVPVHRGHGDRLGRLAPALGHPHQSGRPPVRSLPRHGQRTTAPAQAPRHPGHRGRSGVTRSTPAGGTTGTRAAIRTGTCTASPTSVSGSSAPGPPPSRSFPTSPPSPASSTSSSAHPRRSTSGPTGRRIRRGPPPSSPGGSAREWRTSPSSHRAASPRRTSSWTAGPTSSGSWSRGSATGHRGPRATWPASSSWPTSRRWSRSGRGWTRSSRTRRRRKP